MGMLDQSSEPLLTSVSKSIFAALNARDVAIAYMKKKDPPPVAGDGRVHAGASGAPIAAGWSSIGQAVLPDLDDEQQMLDGIRPSVKLSPGRAPCSTRSRSRTSRPERRSTRTGRQAPSATRDEPSEAGSGRPGSRPLQFPEPGISR